ncbi:MAG: hypothetical protein ACE5PO_09000 [Candidatus Bathyarchaeia archaeon]
MNVAVAVLNGNGEEIASLLRVLNPEKLFIITTQNGVDELNSICRKAKWNASSETLRVFVVRDPDAGYMAFYDLAEAWMDELLALPGDATVYIHGKPFPSTSCATPTLEYLLNVVGSNLMVNRENTRVVEVAASDPTVEPRIIQHYPTQKVCTRCGRTFQFKMTTGPSVADVHVRNDGIGDVCPECLSV